MIWCRSDLVLEKLDFKKFSVVTRGKKKVWDYFSVTQLANFSLQTSQEAEQEQKHADVFPRDNKIVKVCCLPMVLMFLFFSLLCLF